jgi:general secretion pathway protein D
MSEFDSGTEANLRSRGAEPSSTSQQAAAPPQPARALPSEPVPNAAPVTMPGDTPRADTAPGIPLIAPSPPLIPPSETPAPVEPAKEASPPEAQASNATTPPSAEPTPPPSGSSSLYWRGASGANVGSNLSVELWATAAQAVSVVPLTLSYDPRVLAVVSVDQGNFMSNAGTASSLSKRAEVGTGVIRAVLTAAGGTGAAAQGALVRIVFKALSASDGTRVALTESVNAVSATGEPLAFASPAEWLIKVK